MSVLNVKIDNEKKQQLEAIASIQGKTLNDIFEELIDMYIDSFRQDKELMSILKVSEPSFKDWDNDEDSVYNTL
jgi:NRPS condensation-like uncharacterized protein